MKQITSLRGLAIILIILFHLNPEHFPYGYFGVEVFLVISGYLLMKSFQKQQMQIRLGEFARKKVLRLFTPVAVIIPLTLLAGMFFLDYTDLATASSTGGYTLIGAANRFLAVIQSDYFAQDSSGNPFLHMWYLAVTAQIYLLFAGGMRPVPLPSQTGSRLSFLDRRHRVLSLGLFLSHSQPVAGNRSARLGAGPPHLPLHDAAPFMGGLRGDFVSNLPPLKFNTLRKPQEKRSPLSSWNIMHPRACPFPRKGCLPLLGGRSFGDMPGDPV